MENTLNSRYNLDYKEEFIEKGEVICILEEGRDITKSSLELLLFYFIL